MKFLTIAMFVLVAVVALAGAQDPPPADLPNPGNSGLLPGAGAGGRKKNQNENLNHNVIKIG
nr:uncharacterized protein LOC123002999 [Drosophila takahashii]